MALPPGGVAAVSWIAGMRSVRTLAGRDSNARGILFNLAGAAAPAALALLCIPWIASTLGAARFGVLALAWTAIGYVAFLHLGLGRAVARGTAAAGSEAEGDELRATVWTALGMTMALGALGAAALFAFAPGVVRLLHMPAALAGEATAAFRVLACAVPFTVTTPVLSGVLEARRRFGVVNAVTVPSALVTYLGPVAALAVSHTLVPLVAVLAVGRVLSWAAFFVLCLREVPELRSGPTFHGRLARPLLSYGGWTTVSALVSPLLVYMDRFVIGAAVSAAAVAYYATAQEVVLRTGLVSGAVVGVLFPAFASVPGHDGRRVAHLLESGVDAVLVLVLPLALILAAAAEPLLQFWLGGDYAAQGAHVLAWLSFGLVVNGLAKVPSTMLQAVGRPDLTARLHLMELPGFIVVLGVLVWAWGLEGAAVAWVVRVTADSAGLYWFAWRRVPETRSAAVRAAWVTAYAAVGGGALRLAGSPLLRVGLLAVAGIALLWAVGRILHRRAATS
jgi:O-antigen/teichoic acid export membrane protein